MDAEPIHMTPANVANNRKEMRPLPLRVADSQYIRLKNARDRTGISVQEHVRRAIDAYLATTEKEAIELGLMLPASPYSQSPRGGQGRPRVAKR